MIRLQENVTFSPFFSMTLGVYSVTSQSKRKCNNANAGKTEHVGSKSPYIK